MYCKCLFSDLYAKVFYYIYRTNRKVFCFFVNVLMEEHLREANSVVSDRPIDSKTVEWVNKSKKNTGIHFRGKLEIAEIFFCDNRWRQIKNMQRCSTPLPAHPCLLACLRVVLYKDGVCGREVKSSNAGFSLAWWPVQETHIFHLKETHRINIRDREMC